MELWTKEHAITLLPALAVMIVVGVLLYRVLGNKSDKARMLPIQLIACLLIVLEVGKQGLSLMRGYDLYHLPFHFCSLFIFALPFMAFYKGKHISTVRGVTAALCMAVFLLMLIYPNLIYSAGNIREYFTDYFSFHTVTFHNLVMLALVLIVALGLYTPSERGEGRAVLLFGIWFSVVAASMAHLLKTNYANFYTCNIPILETVRLNVAQAAGEVPAKLLYILIVALLQTGFTYGAYHLCALLCRSKKKMHV